MAAMEEYDDNYLIVLIGSGDEAAFQIFFDRRMGDVFKLSYSLLLDKQMAEDATQEVFVKIWQKAVHWKADAAVKTWLLTIARNHCLDVLRKKRNDLKKHHSFFTDMISLDKDVKANSSESKIDQEKHKGNIKNALFELPERQREAITLVYYNEVRNLEAAGIMGLQVAAFDSLLARARRNLRKQLEGEEDLLRGYSIK